MTHNPFRWLAQRRRNRLAEVWEQGYRLGRGKHEASLAHMHNPYRKGAW